MKPTVAQLRRLVGNPAAYAVQQDDGSWRPVREPLTDFVLADHLKGLFTVGTYIGHRRTFETVHDGAGPTGVGEETVARTLVFDVDSGDEDEVSRILEALATLGLSEYCWGTETSGRKGWHIWVLLARGVPASDLRRFGRAVLALAGVVCEVNPKQDEVRDLGNLVKLPGGVHRVTGNTAEFVDRVPTPLPVAVFERLLGNLPPEVRAQSSAPSETRFPCMEDIQTWAVEEGGRNIQLFHLATLLRRGGVSDSYVDYIVRDVNERCSPPLDNSELDVLVESSKTSGPLCHLLPEERQCGELCIKARTKGLYTRPGQLRHAAAGENVVVTVESNDGQTVTFAHDDVSTAKAKIRRGP
jgi:hypothetical protein